MITSLKAEMDKFTLHDGPETAAFVLGILRQEAESTSNKAADRIRAAELLGKTHFTALFREQIEQVTVQRTDTEVKAELLQRLSKLAKG